MIFFTDYSTQQLSAVSKNGQNGGLLSDEGHHHLLAGSLDVIGGGGGGIDQQPMDRSSVIDDMPFTGQASSSARLSMAVILIIPLLRFLGFVPT